MRFSLIIRNGTIVDGSGLTPYRADVGIVGDTIRLIGRISERGDQEIDAEGHVVTPGFIDGHTHLDAQFFWDPLGTCSSWHGVTTVVMGNCGFTLAPAKPDARDLVLRNLERSEDIPKTALDEGVEWSWETFPEYLTALAELPKGINVAGYVGHSALRTWTMGERAFDGASSDDDLATMETALREALEAGAVGFSTSRSPFHRLPDDRPVASRSAEWDEVAHLVRAMATTGAGIFEIALNERTDEPEETRAQLSSVEALAIETGVPVTFGVTPGANAAPRLQSIDAVEARNGRMFAQSRTQPSHQILSFMTQLPFDKLPEWQAIRTLPLEEQAIRLSSPGERQKLVEAAHRGPYGFVAAGAEARPPDYDAIRILDQPLPPNPTVAEVAAARRMDPVEVMIDLSLKRDFQQLFVHTTARDQTEDLLEIMKHPRAVMTFSDTGAHVSQHMGAMLQTNLLAQWVRERQDFSLQEAVRMITLVPAIAWGIPHRGLIREGMTADVNIFDPARVGPEMPTVIADLPGGNKRIVQGATGFLATVVAGEILYRQGKHSGALPGRLIRGPLAG